MREAPTVTEARMWIRNNNKRRTPLMAPNHNPLIPLSIVKQH